MSSTVVMIMAGGKGSRLAPLTCHRAKPAVPFGGRYRIIDFVLSNFINSGYGRIFVLTQYMASSLIRHLSRNWHLAGINEWIEIVPAQMRQGERWYQGTADSVFQNINLIRDTNPEHVAVFGGDHIYKFAVDQMEEEHLANSADLTVAAFPVPVEDAHRYGVIEVDSSGRIIGFQEKPEKGAKTIPGRPGHCLVSMGNYFFRTESLIQTLKDDAEDPDSKHDFGHNIIPRMVAEGRVVLVYDFGNNRIAGEPGDAKPYWRDVGTVDSYFLANMELRSPLPTLNLYNRNWRIRTAQRDYPPARFVRHQGFAPADSVDSLICEGSIVQSAELREAMLGYDCFVRAGAKVQWSVLLNGCCIGEGAQLRSVVCDKNCTIEPGAMIGIDADLDRERFPFRSDSGLVVLPKGTVVPPEGPIELAHDMAELLHKDPATAQRMKEFADRMRVSTRHRHSNHSSGPRYRF